MLLRTKNDIFDNMHRYCIPCNRVVRNDQAVVVDEIHSSVDVEHGAIGHAKLYDHVDAVELFDVAVAYKQVLRTEEQSDQVQHKLLPCSTHHA